MYRVGLKATKATIINKMPAILTLVGKDRAGRPTIVIYIASINSVSDRN